MNTSLWRLYRPFIYLLFTRAIRIAQEIHVWHMKIESHFTLLKQSQAIVPTSVRSLPCKATQNTLQCFNLWKRCIGWKNRRFPSSKSYLVLNVEGVNLLWIMDIEGEWCCPLQATSDDNHCFIRVDVQVKTWTQVVDPNEMHLCDPFWQSGVKI